MRLPRLVAVVVLLVTILSPVALPGGTGTVVAAPAALAAQASCVNGTQLVTNGSFESPGLGGATSNPAYTPTGWTGTTEGRDRSLNTAFAVGDVYLINTGLLTQTISTAGLAGAKITVRYRTAGFGPGVSVAGVIAGTGTVYNGFDVSNTLTLGSTVGTTTVTISAGGQGAIDTLSITVAACNQPPVFDPSTVQNRTGEVNRSMGGALVAFAPVANDPDGDALSVICRIPLGTISGF